MAKKRPKVALVYDFDGTLSPGNMQEFGFIQATGKTKDEFWEKNRKFAEGKDANGILTYMYLMLDEAKKNNISLTRESFQKFGKDVELFRGVKQWFSLVNEYGNSIGLDVKHYINSSGLKEMIEGTPIAHEFENIYACSFLYNKEGIAYWPAVAVDYTTKTQFLFKINKGIKQVSDNRRVNQYIPDEKRPIPFPRMIYFGDGETDVPCMKMVKEHGGHAIAVYNTPEKEAMACQLVREGRANFMCTANYSRGGVMNIIVKRILDKIKADFEFDRLIEVNQKKAWK